MSIDYVGRVWQDILPHVEESIELGDFKVMMNRYWQHKTSGEVYAVQIEDERAVVVSACGPLHHSEVTNPNLETWNFNNDPELAIDLTMHFGYYNTYSLIPHDETDPFCCCDECLAGLEEAGLLTG